MSINELQKMGTGVSYLFKRVDHEGNEKEQWCH